METLLRVHQLAPGGAAGSLLSACVIRAARGYSSPDPLGETISIRTSIGGSLSGSASRPTNRGIVAGRRGGAAQAHQTVSVSSQTLGLILLRVVLWHVAAQRNLCFPPNCWRIQGGRLHAFRWRCHQASP